MIGDGPPGTGVVLAGGAGGLVVTGRVVGWLAGWVAGWLDAGVLVAGALLAPGELDEVAVPGPLVGLFAVPPPQAARAATADRTSTAPATLMARPFPTI